MVQIARGIVAGSVVPEDGANQIWKLGCQHCAEDDDVREVWTTLFGALDGEVWRGRPVSDPRGAHEIRRRIVDVAEQFVDLAERDLLGYHARSNGSA